MAILQALLALITRSVGKILNAVFGWAVHALFGQTSSAVLALVAAVAGAWGWSRRLRHPMERTRRTIQEDVQWAKEKIA